MGLWAYGLWAYGLMGLWAIGYGLWAMGYGLLLVDNQTMWPRQ